MKRCIKCGEKLFDTAKFCSYCGASQERSMKKEESSRLDILRAELGSNIKSSEEKNNAMSQASDLVTTHLPKLAYVGLALIVFSLITPIIQIVGLVRFAILDYSGILGFLIMIICALAAYCTKQKNYLALVVCANGLLIFLVVGWLYYQLMIYSLRKNYLGMFASKAASIEFGAYIFLVGILIVVVVGLICTIIQKSEAINTENLVKYLKESILGSVKILGIPLPGILWSVLIGALLIFTAVMTNPLDELQNTFGGRRGYR